MDTNASPPDQRPDLDPEEARFRAVYERMGLGSLVTEWDESLSGAARRALYAELEARGYRVAGLSSPSGADETPGSSSLAPKRRWPRGAGWVLAIGIVQLAIGVPYGVMASLGATRALQDFSPHATSDIVHFEGQEWIIADLRAELELERVLLIAIPVAVGLLFIGLYLWARRSPLPALVTTLLLYGAGQIASAVADPSTMHRGILFKLLVLGGIVAGIRSTLAGRAAGQPGPSGASRPGEER